MVASLSRKRSRVQISSDPLILYLQDNFDNDNKIGITKLKAKSLASAMEEANKKILDIRFGEDRDEEGPDDDPKSIFPKSNSFNLESATLLEVSSEIEIDIDKMCDSWAIKWKKK